MNEDMKEYLGVFLDEANEQMELLEQDILVLETAPSPQPDEFQTVLSANEQMALQEAQENQNTIYALIVRVASDCVMKSVRALMVLQTLETVGSILATTPGEEALENEDFENEFEV